MPLTSQQNQIISDFTSRPEFIEKGGLITDLDGTVIQQHEGRYFMPEEVGAGLTELYLSNCTVIINSMRFPLSVINTFANDWYGMSHASIPLVSLNGSQAGYIHKEESSFTFEEVMAFPLTADEIGHLISDVDAILNNGRSALVFYYPRDWKKGEIIWTPVQEKVDETRDKYRSASTVYSSNLDTLKEHLLAEDICMIFLLPVEVQSDTPFQHTDHKDFYSHEQVNKLYGAKKFLSHLGLDMQHFIGAGDTPMDVFLKEAGLVLKVGKLNLNFECASEVIELEQIIDIAEVFTTVAECCKHESKAA
ncbi:HAD hydrolase family protein [Dyadobacter flavalbus]|uniref:HAD hydrolase family protein n=1 Tax=Dyadobacter flavalbus TaxID=2579942 RepID=A0A5M8QNZ9_9BACT|nr:HAD hydrolase family protein [Dyadobacter flavalbus]KAA6436750.1 HAD hydrolase family protein [Dyadobacter flavalbus]